MLYDYAVSRKVAGGDQGDIFRATGRVVESPESNAGSPRSRGKRSNAAHDSTYNGAVVLKLT